MSPDIRVSNSKIKTWRRCPNKYRYKYVMKLRPKKKGVALERGSWIHELLMVHYDGEDWKERHQLLTKKFNNLFEEEREMLGDLPRECSRIMRSYLRYYQEEDKRYEVIDSEVDEIITLPNGLRINIIIDLIVWDHQMEGIWLWDHKTRKSFEDSDNMMLDPQLTHYYHGAEILGYTPLLGAVTNEIRTKAPTVPKLLARGGLSKAKNIDTDVWTYMSAIRRHDLDPADYGDVLRSIATRQKDKFFRRTPMPKDPPMIKTMTRELVQSTNEILHATRKNAFPRTFDNSCKWGCEYRDICIAELHGGDISSMVKMNFTTDRREKD
jgi:hypothetical protein